MGRAQRTLFVDAARMGEMATRVHRVLTSHDVSLIAETYRSWRSGDGYTDVPGLCRSVETQEIAESRFVLTPGRYVGRLDDDAGVSTRTPAELAAALESQLRANAEIAQRVLSHLEQLK